MTLKKDPVVWVGKVFILLEIPVRRNYILDEYFLLQCMKGTHTIDKFDVLLGRLSLRRATEDESEHIMSTMVSTGNSSPVSVR